MDDPLRKIDATLAAKGFKFVRPPGVYRGPILVHGTEATIEIDVDDVTFARLPTVKLIDASKLPIKKLAHLIGEADVCYFDGSLPLDLYDPGGSILRVLIEVATALERSFGGRAAAEFERELASYWRGKRLLFAVARQNAPSITYGDAIGHTADESSGVVVIPRGAWKDRKPRSRERATILHFREKLGHTTDFPLRSLSEALTYIGAQRSPPAGWQKAVKAAAAANEYLFLTAPNAIIGWVPKFPPNLAAIRVRTDGFRKGFFAKTMERSMGNIELNRVTGAEADLRFCVERNLGGGPSLIGKRVALIGCGTIGGYLARMLVQAGAGCESMLHLYDPDKLSPGNLGRHILGFDDLWKNKAQALAAHLRAFHPDVAVTARTVDATKEWTTLEGFDLLIDATGEENVATALNHDFLRSTRSGTDVALLHAWVFGNGVAAQSFLNLKDGLACYRCLRTGFGGDWRHNPLKDRSSPLIEAPGRCGEGGYAPFGVEASVSAASLALRAAVEWAAGRPGKRLRTTVVDREAGRENVAWESPKALLGCPACGS